MFPAISLMTPAAKERHCTDKCAKLFGGFTVMVSPETETAADDTAIVWSVVGHVDPPDFTTTSPVAA